MKNIVLLSFALITFSSFAQDWAPFKTTDTIRHYSSALNLNSPPSQNSQIQSVVMKSKAVAGSKTTSIFKKGITRFYSQFWDTKQIVKGQIFGDTAFITLDSTVFKTIDRQGFSLSFPNHYYQNQLFTLATNQNNQQIHALVDSVYIDSVNNTIDSLSRFRLTFIDSLGFIDTLSNYHNAEVVISKSNGMILGIDFTNLKVVVPVIQYFSSNNKLTNADHFSLTTNDEYHYSDNLQNGGFGNYYQTIVKIFNDSTSANQRTLTFEKRRQKVNPLPAGPVVTSVSNYTFPATAVFAVFESQIIEDSALTIAPLWTSTVPEVSLFYLCQYCGFNQLGLTIDSINYNIEFSFLTGKKDSIVDNTSFLNYGYKSIMVGVGDYGYYNYLGNNNSSSKSIDYVKKGNQMWGTPYNLSVGLNEEVQDKRELVLYPNPVNGVLHINSKSNYSSIEILKVNGQLVATFTKQETYNVSELSSGVYFLRVFADDGVTAKKFVKE